MPLVMAFVAMFLGGCWKPMYRGTVSALARVDDLEPTSFTIIPSNENVDAQELEFASYVKQVQQILEEAGYSKAAEGAKASLVITLDYTLGEPVAERMDLPAPVYGPVGSATATTYGTVNPVAGGAVLSGTTYTTQQMGVVGYNTASFTYYTRLSRVELRAYDAAFEERSAASELWRLTSQSGMATENLGSLFPYHALALQPYIARSTAGGAVAVTIPLNDPRVAKLRGK